MPVDLVSICVTNFNYGIQLSACLDSLKAQTHSELDLVIVDDCSSEDLSVDIVLQWCKTNASRFYRLILVRHSKNRGPSEARNSGFAHALSDYVFVIDADNEVYPRAISRLYSSLLSGGFMATYCQLQLFGDKSGIGHADIWDPVAIRQSNYVDVMAVVAKSAWRAVGGYSHIDQGWEDYDFWLKFIDHDFPVGYVPEILCRYQVHEKSRTAREAHAAHERLRLIMAFRHPSPVKAAAGRATLSELQGKATDALRKLNAVGEPFAPETSPQSPTIEQGISISALSPAVYPPATDPIRQTASGDFRQAQGTVSARARRKASQP